MRARNIPSSRKYVEALNCIMKWQLTDLVLTLAQNKEMFSAFHLITMNG
jgi:hypothetical protein